MKMNHRFYHIKVINISLNDKKVGNLKTFRQTDLEEFICSNISKDAFRVYQMLDLILSILLK